LELVVLKNKKNHLHSEVQPVQVHFRISMLSGIV